MALVIHHRHTIVSTPVYDENTGKWKLSASISSPQIEGAPKPLFHELARAIRTLPRRRKGGAGSRKNQIDSDRRKVAAA